MAFRRTIILTAMAAAFIMAGFADAGPKPDKEIAVADNNAFAFDLYKQISSGDGKVYDGFLKRNGETVEAYEGRFPVNSIQR